MGNLLLLLVNHIGTVTSIMKLVEQGVEIAPKIIKDTKNQFDAITEFWATGLDPTDEEMGELIDQRKSLENAILAVNPQE